MKKIVFNRTLLIIFLLISSFGNSSASLFFPLQIGNKFVYHYYSSSVYPGGHSSVSYDFMTSVTKDTLINNKKYFFLKNSISMTGNWYRVDSLTGSLYMFDENNNCVFYNYERLVDSLMMPIHGTSNYCNPIHVDTIMNVTMWDIPGTEKTFRRTDFGMSVTTTTRVYNSFFGSVARYFSQSSYVVTSESTTLKGCVINGVTYGDTIVIGVINLNSQIPDKFVLFQNYPNPFNQTSIFKFQCSKRGNVNVSVYDITGREVRTIVNESLEPGTYEVRFDGGGLNSGVYFVRMTAGEFTETRRMVLLK